MSERAAETHARIVREIVKEKAVTLGRAGERLEAALAEVVAVARAWRAAGDAAERERLTAAYDRAWRAADTALGRRCCLDWGHLLGLYGHHPAFR